MTKKERQIIWLDGETKKKLVELWRKEEPNVAFNKFLSNFIVKSINKYSQSNQSIENFNNSIADYIKAINEVEKQKTEIEKELKNIKEAVEILTKAWKETEYLTKPKIQTIKTCCGEIPISACSGCLSYLIHSKKTHF